MKTYTTSGTGSQQTLSPIETDKIPVYDSVTDAEADLANLSENQIIATHDTGSELSAPVDTVQSGNMHAVTSNAVYNATLNVETARYHGNYGAIIDCKKCGKTVEITVSNITNATLNQDMAILQSGVMNSKFRVDTQTIVRGNTSTSNWGLDTAVGISFFPDGSIFTYSYRNFDNGFVKFTFIKD